MEAFCADHSWVKRKIDELDKDVDGLSKKWEKLQGWLVGIMVTLVFNLIGIILLLVLK